MKKLLNIFGLICFVTLYLSCSKEETINEKDELIFEYNKENVVYHKQKWIEKNLQNYNYTEYVLTSHSGPIEEVIEVRNGKANNITNPANKAETITELYEKIEKIADKYLDPAYTPKGREHYRLTVYCDATFNIPIRYVFTTYSSPNGSDVFYRDYTDFEIIDN